jgi:hypothetical protein
VTDLGRDLNDNAGNGKVIKFLWFVIREVMWPRRRFAERHQSPSISAGTSVDLVLIDWVRYTCRKSGISDRAKDIQNFSELQVV